jgi:hypothetical protein
MTARVKLVSIFLRIRRPVASPELVELHAPDQKLFLQIDFSAFNFASHQTDQMRRSLVSC